MFLDECIRNVLTFMVASASGGFVGGILLSVGIFVVVRIKRSYRRRSIKRYRCNGLVIIMPPQYIVVGM